MDGRCFAVCPRRSGKIARETTGRMPRGLTFNVMTNGERAALNVINAALLLANVFFTGWRIACHASVPALPSASLL